MRCQFLWLVAMAPLLWAVAESAPDDRARPDDGLRKLEAARYGVTVRHPPGWQLTNLQRGTQVFQLGLPEDHPQEPAGNVSCEIGAAPQSLSDFQKRLTTRADGVPTDRKLVENTLLEPRLNGKRAEILEAIWMFTRPRQKVCYELQRLVISNCQLYTFTLTIDEGHFDAYRLDFARMVETAEFSPIDSGLDLVPGGYWMQRDFHFGVVLPEGWRPALGASEKTLYFATGASKQTFTENLSIMAAPRQPIPFEMLRAELPGQIIKTQPNNRVVRCEILPWGKQRMLEVVIQTPQGDVPTTTVERRIQGERMNYELRFTVRTETFNTQEKQLQTSADSFREFQPPRKSRVLSWGAMR